MSKWNSVKWIVRIKCWQNGLRILSNGSISNLTSGFMTREVVNYLQSDSTHYQWTHLTNPHITNTKAAMFYFLYYVLNFFVIFIRKMKYYSSTGKLWTVWSTLLTQLHNAVSFPKGTCWHSHRGYLDITA